MSCRLSLFGPPALLNEAGRPIPVPAKTFALVAYIILSGGGAPVSRGSLRRFLWPNSDAKTAAANLRKFLLRVRERQELYGFELIRCEHNHVELAASAVIDLAQFLKTISGPDTADLVSLCEIFRGDLLEGMEWEEAESNEWMALQRTKLCDLFVGVVASRLEPIEPTADRIPLRIAARRLVEVDPYNETGHRALMLLFSEAGEPARVRDVYRRLEQRLREELEVDPDTVTVELYHSLSPHCAPAKVSPPPSEPERRPAALQRAPFAEALVPQSSNAASERSGAPKITILPPLVLNGADFRQQVAISLIEDVTINLCRFRALSVVAPHTAMELSAGGKKNLISAYGIDYAVETQLQSRAGEPWLSVKLLDAPSRRIVWTEQYDLNRAQTVQSYRSLSTQILSSLVERVERTELMRGERAQNPTAYHLYLVGQRFLHTLDLPNIRRARRAFKTALSVAPEFVPTLSGLARTLRLEWVLLARGDPDLLVEAERLADRAVELDPDDARGYRELGACKLYVGEFDECLDAFGKAEMRNPQFADLLIDFGDALTHACEPAEGLQKIERAIELNPLCPDQYWWAAGGANFHLHKYEDAIRCIQSMHDQTPAYRLLAASWARLGERERAGQYVQKVMDVHPDFSVASWLTILPIRDLKYERDYEQGLREAGFD